MSLIKPNAKLIPRFNIDYNVKDFTYSLVNLKTEADITHITRLFSNSSIEFTNSGRTSLYVILKALNLHDNSSIGVPLYCCPSVFDAIVHAGHRPVFLDIDPVNYTLEPKHLEEKIEEIDAVIVINTFGRLADFQKILKIADGKPVIEDCAHALLSKYNGKLAGTIATAGFFSFRAGKYISAGEGGMVITEDPVLAKNIKKEVQKLQNSSSADEMVHTIKTFARSTLYHRPWFGIISLPLGRIIEDKVDLMNKYSFKTTKIRNTNLLIAAKKLYTFQDKVEIQRKNSQYLLEELSNSDLILPFETKDAYCNYYLFPIQTNELKRDRVCECLRKKGIDTTTLFSKTPTIARLLYGYSGDCPNTEKVANQIITIRNFYTLEKNELKNIAEAMISCLMLEN